MDKKLPTRFVASLLFSYALRLSLTLSLDCQNRTVYSLMDNNNKKIGIRIILAPYRQVPKLHTSSLVPNTSIIHGTIPQHFKGTVQRDGSGRN
jgi:hypothetical protein